MNKEPNTMRGQLCPMCHKKTLTLIEEEMEVPYFGKLSLFSMTCASCKYHKADIESLEKKDPCKYSIEISSENDMKIRIVKSSQATVKIPHITTIDPGIVSNGYITNVEGLLNRVKQQIEQIRDSEEDDSLKKKAKNMLKKLTKVTWGNEKLKIIIEDPSGNSAIISEKAVKSKL
ncbi:MAG: ZPR1 zinc finger domain-containing protein [Nanoarchaeota archaeon]|nr:ZPR1 zinc finger domain-containing protein [Nanoarchaeota archaeon]